MSKHTPGPWKWDGDVWNYDKEEEAPWLIDTIGSHVPILGGAIRCSKEADARLIAAAPELLKALETLVLVVGLTAFKHESQRAVLQEAVDLSRAAISKATGETK